MAWSAGKQRATFAAALALVVLSFSNIARAEFLRLSDVQDDGTVMIEAKGKAAPDIQVGMAYNLFDQTGNNGTVKVTQVAKYYSQGVITGSGWRARKGGYYSFYPTGWTAPKPATILLRKGRIEPIVTMKRAPLSVFEIGKDPLVGREPKPGDNRPPRKHHVEIVELHPPKKNSDISARYAGTIPKPQEEIVRDKKKADTRAAERKADDDEVPARLDLSSVDGTTGFVLFPSARVIGEHNQRARYTFSFAKAELLDPYGYSLLYKTKSHSFSVGWGLTANTEVSYCYTALKGNERFIDDTVPRDIKQYRKIREHTMTVKRSLFKQDPGQARLSLFAREDMKIFDGGRTDENIFTALVADMPFWNNNAELTAIYGVDSTGKDNDERYGAGLRIELSDRLLTSAEWYRQKPGETSSGTDEKNSYAFSAQYRVDSNYSLNVSYENMDNFLWGSQDEGSKKTVNFSLVHSTN